jgi:15-cis-phytoene synthase
MIENKSSQTWESVLLKLADQDAAPAAPLVIESGCLEESRAVREAYRHCSQITSAHSRSFYIASGLLPHSKRQAVRALYAFCRAADDIVDRGLEPRYESLHHYRHLTLADLPDCDHSISLAWTDARRRYAIPDSYAHQLLEGIESDLCVSRYPTFDELAVYCYRVACTVGLMSMHITGYSHSQAIPYAVRLGIALQLTNILRDIGEDWKRGRLYLPLDELEFFNIREADLDDFRVTEAWRLLMRFQIARARRFYREAAPGISLLHRDGRFAVHAAAVLYEGILDDIEAHDYDVFSRRAHVPGPRKLRLLLRAFIRSRKSRAEFDPHPLPLAP